MSQNLLAKQDLSQFIQPGRVHRQIYTDPAIFELELERIFGVAWIYVGHESQVKNPGDYFRSFIGRKPVVLVRDAGGAIRVIHNQCAHRGSMVVANDKGNASEFQCCYHGWTYHLDGRLKAVPLQHEAIARKFRSEQSQDRDDADGAGQEREVDIRNINSMPGSAT